MDSFIVGLEQQNAHLGQLLRPPARHGAGRGGTTMYDQWEPPATHAPARPQTGPAERLGVGASDLPPSLRSRLPPGGSGSVAEEEAELGPLPQGMPQEVVMLSMFRKQNALLARLQPRARSRAEAVSGILRGSDDASGDDGGGLRIPRAKGAAARESFRSEVRRNPLNIARGIYRNVQSALACGPLPQGHNTTNPTQGAGFGTYRTLAYT